MIEKDKAILSLKDFIQSLKSTNDLFRGPKNLEKAEVILSHILMEKNVYIDGSNKIEFFVLLRNIFDGFHLFSRQLLKRYIDLPTIEVKDEYDVQDLPHAILKMFFKDIRAEEGTPSCAGSSSRIDFLLKERYQSHSDCKHLTFFVYAPEGILKNPRGPEKEKILTLKYLYL